MGVLLFVVVGVFSSCGFSCFFLVLKNDFFSFFKFMNDDVIFVTVEYYFDLELNSNIQGHFD